VLAGWLVHARVLVKRSHFLKSRQKRTDGHL